MPSLKTNPRQVNP